MQIVEAAVLQEVLSSFLNTENSLSTAYIKRRDIDQFNVALKWNVVKYAQVAQTFFVKIIALPFEPFKRMYENASKTSLNSPDED